MAQNTVQKTELKIQLKTRDHAHSDTCAYRGRVVLKFASALRERVRVGLRARALRVGAPPGPKFDYLITRYRPPFWMAGGPFVVGSSLAPLNLAPVLKNSARPFPFGFIWLAG